MQYLITGATGDVGSRVVEHLLQRSIQAWVVKVRQMGIQLDPRNFEEVLGTFTMTARGLQTDASSKDPSLATLRGWDDYRFRDRDAALIQAEADYIVWNPFGVYAFYDGGTVAPNPGGLSLSNFRNDAGIGVFARIQGSIIAQTYYAWGRGDGGRWSYNFAKVF